MHDDYLTNPSTYMALEQLFLDAFIKTISEYNNQEEYTAPFYRTTYNNGQSFGDANPIFSARNAKRKKIIRIIIDEDENEISTAYKNTEHGVETIVFGGVSNLPELIAFLDNWTKQP
ncbi:hypothetical protein HB13667_11015 [Pseudomonas putida]|jgi:hypothetical protein|uniref:Uncharacterized protein n=2 Tax=Pseudomonas TaxID=286 RepID=A0A0P7CUA9_PSEPU|nr:MULTISPECIES: hypothetical protein [Pseudomonas]KXK69845.1 hypothetical protein BC89_17025 [Pseudomonas monteilii]KPM65751.1 hypothetical protein HB13667_11015 [Pseudomonas putida]MDM9600078.1 hypothetical protein [Pseudomonas shirazica]QKK97667.1 hypothetical protein GEV38_17575 [Pseudomonas sp. 13159349]UUC16807.1 hypothetical protein NOV18_16210 [Pseudomonas asiatica]